VASEEKGLASSFDFGDGPGWGGGKPMRWTPGGESRNIEDRRGSRGIGMAPMGIGGTIVVLVLSLLFGRNFVGGSGGTE